MYQIYHTSPLPHPGTVSTGVIFAFTYMCILYLHLLLLPQTPPPPPGRTYPAFLFSDFVEEKNIKDSKKNKTFLLV
jgi:hypothetical protein